MAPMMQAALVEQPGNSPAFGQLPVSRPGAGQVLIRVAASPVNPSDFGFMNGSYGFQKPFPVVPGFEGSGSVVAGGAGILPQLLVGRRVAFSAPDGGAWAEYVVTSATGCIPLPRHLSLEQGAALVVNPLTALALVEIARKGKHAAIVSNAAAGALGQMLLRLGQRFRIPIIHVVRRAEQIELLRARGGEYILNSSASNFHQELQELAQRLKATLILDSVGGEESNRLLQAAPRGSRLVRYGLLSGQTIDLSPEVAADGDKRIESFFLPDWMKGQGLLKTIKAVQNVRSLARYELKTTVQQRFALAKVAEAIALYQANPTAGKVLLVADPAKVAVDG